MKRFSILISLFAVAMVGCNNEVNTPVEWGDTSVTLDPSKHYIHFDADINTRGALIEGNVLQADFAVLGYQYPGTWEAEKVFATPNVFDVAPQIVRYEGGVFTYGDPKVWTGNKYSFFAYYPSDSKQITLTTDQGEPYIMYKLPSDNDPTKLIDVMTADYIDTGVASSASVALQFRHRLCSVDVGARNYYEYNNDGASKDVYIEITNLTVRLTNIANEEAKIYLNHNIPSEYPDQQAKASRVYDMVSVNSPWAVPTYLVKPNSASDRAIRLVTNSKGENASSMILIPQTALVSGKLDITYRKKYKIDESLADDVADNWVYLHDGDNVNDFDFTPTDLDINFDKQLIEGRRYFIELTFTSDAVSVNVVAADEWNADRNGDGKVDDKDNIYYEFE